MCNVPLLALIQRRGSCCATSPLLATFGRTPAAGRRNPRRGFVIKRFLGCCCSRSWRCWSWAARSEPKPKNEQRKSHPLGGASSRRGGPTEHAVREGGMLHNANLVSESTLTGRAAQHTRLLMQRSLGGARTTHAFANATSPGHAHQEQPPSHLSTATHHALVNYSSSPPASSNATDGAKTSSRRSK